MQQTTVGEGEEKERRRRLAIDGPTGTQMARRCGLRAAGVDEAAYPIH